MKNFVKVVAEHSVKSAFTALLHYQPKMPKSLMAKAMAENKKED